jgi:fructose-1,6-bisphosphatase/inositol monophosphatase family enzyme
MPSSTPPAILSPAMLQQTKEWARQAGQIGLRHFNETTPRIKPDQSFLTSADLEIEHYLIDRIRAAYPDCDVVSEEGTLERAHRGASDVWVIDPLDGTTAFVQGLPGWGIGIGLLHQGQPLFGLFYMPLLDDMTYTDSSRGVFSNSRSLHGAVRKDWGHKGFLAVSATAHRDFTINVQRTRTLNSVGASLVYTARGAAAAAFIAKAHLWDLVAGAAILSRAGGELRFLSGGGIDYATLLDGRLAREPIIAGHPGFVAELQRLIQPRA